MSTIILNKINSLNSRNIKDYQFLVFKIRPIIVNVRSGRPVSINSDEDLSDYYFDRESFDYVTDKYNEKLDLFYLNFFEFGGEELIREEVKINNSILEEVKSSAMFYFMGFEQNSMQVSYGPSSIDKTRARENRFNHNYNSGYYLKPRTSKRLSKKSEGCFIATFAYDSYNHPDVLILRKFRDDSLYKSSFGRGFIKIYYLTSPKFVVFLELLNIPKKIIRVPISLILSLFK